MSFLGTCDLPHKNCGEKIFFLHEILRFFLNSDKYNQFCIFLDIFSPEDGGEEGRDEDEREEEEEDEDEEEERRVFSVEQEFDFKSFVARYSGPLF